MKINKSLLLKHQKQRLTIKYLPVYMEQNNIEYQGWISIDEEPIYLRIKAEHWINTIRELEWYMDVYHFHPINKTINN
jgi:hypothetical protein